MLNNIAIIAGSGDLPLIVAKFLKKNKRNFIVLSIKNFSKIKLYKNYKSYSLRLGQGGKAINILNKNKIQNIIFLGGLRKPNFFNLKPDLWTLFKVLSFVSFKKTDDLILRKVISIFENEGFKVIGLSDITNNFFLKEGVYGKKRNIKKNDYKILKKNITNALIWTKKDLGQSVISTKKKNILYENNKGTNFLIKKIIRSKKYSKYSYLFIKLKKLNQDTRIDLPTFGAKTLKYLVKTNIKYIVLQAESTVIINKKKVFKYLKKYNKTLLSVKINYFSHNDNCYIKYE